MRTRTKVPGPTQQLVLLEAGYRCANPVCRNILTLEIHHIVWVKDGGGDTVGNLLALCSQCHDLHTYGHIPAAAIRTWKSILVSIGNANRTNLDLLLVLAQEEERIETAKATRQQKALEFKKELDQRGEIGGIGFAVVPPFRFTGDSLGFLAPLLTAGLLEITARCVGGNRPEPPYFEIALTPRGRALIKAWREGSPEGVQRALESVIR